MKSRFHSEGHEEELNLELTAYRKDLVKQYGSSLLASIWISILVSHRKMQLKHQKLHEVSKHY